MFAVKSRVDVFVRVVIIASVLFNALAPIPALAQPATSPEVKLVDEAITDSSRSLPEQSRSYFEPPMVEQPQRRSPDPDRPEPQVPAKDGVEFTLVADPAIVLADGLVRFNVYIRNNTEDPLQDVVFADALETGLEYQQNDASPVTFDIESRKVNFAIGNLEPNEELSFYYTVSVTSSHRNQTRGKIWLHSAELNSEPSGIQLKTSAAMGVDLEPASAETQLAPMQLNGGWSDLGRVAIHMERENVGRNAFVLASPTQINGNGPALQFELDVFEADPLAADSRGRYNEQAISLRGAYRDSFKKSAFLEISLDDYVDLHNIPAGQEPYVATYDETHEIWVKVPILETDYEQNSVTVEAAHFSTWGAGLGSSLPQNGANVLLFDQPYTSLFTGSSRYSIPVWTPPGRAGMQPDISLSYSSGTVDGVLGDVQAPWVGIGWNLDAVEIVRKITSDENGYGYRNEFALTLNGSLYQLVRDEVHQNRYYTDQAAFLYVERHNYAFDNTPSTENATGEWWEVVTTDGTRYRLGWNEDSEQLALMYGYACTINGLDCITPDGAYASLGYAGKARDLVAMRWRVDRVSDAHGNYMAYHYFESQPNAATTIAAFDRESYLESIKYTGFEDPDGIAPDVQPGYQITFVRDERSTVGDVPTEFNVWDNLDSEFLDKIEVFCLVCEISPSATAIRTYDFEYSLAPVPNANGTLTLTSLKILGGGYSENGIEIPPTTAPTIRFTYQDLPNRDITGTTNDAFKYPRLTTIDNGSGGLMTFTYENDNVNGSRGTNSWYNYRVQNVLVDGGMGAIKKQAYTYVTPVYSGIGGNPGLGSLMGYTNVSETLLDFNNADVTISQTKHTFGTTGLDVGRELQTDLLDSAGTALRRTMNIYVTDNSKAPFPGWNYRYLGQTQSYARTGGTLVQTSKSTYYHDPATGNPLVQSTYLGNSLYRKTYYEYLTNPNPAVYLLDKVSRVLLVAADNQIYSDIRYHYDGRINQYPTRGDVTFVQKLTGSGTQTIDSWTNYDPYGNAISSRAYREYGEVNVPPSADYYESSMAYDTNEQKEKAFVTYPVSVANALGNVTNSNYLYTLGAPYRVTDPNTWITETTYDGLGRTLSVTPPGLNQPGTWFIYPSPDTFTGRLPAPHSVEMQILDTIAGRYRSVWGIYDGAGRMLQTQVDAGDQLLVNTTLFNAQGLPSQQSLPYYVNGAGGNYTYNSGNQFTTTQYDSLGRATEVTAPGNIISHYDYDGLTTTSVDPKGNQIVRKSDGLGRMTEVVEYSDASTVYATTKYNYDNADRLVKVTDAQSNATTIQYDWLGRKTGMDDPDMGVWTYQYDSLGNMDLQKDARNHQLTFEYDALNRLLIKNDDDPNTPATTYTYGSTPGTIGLRVGMNDPSGSTTWNYSDYARTVTESRTIAGETHSLTSHSDWLGRALHTTYDDGEVVSYNYDELGRPDQLKSGETSLVDIAYNTLGQIATQTLGNGTVITNTYNSETNRLEQRQAVNNSVTQLDLSYSYDSNGNITRLTDGQLNETQFYRYDFLNRLTSAVSVDGTPTLEPALPENYGQQFEYDQVGNMLKMYDWGTPPTPLAYQGKNGIDLAVQDENIADQAQQVASIHPVAYHPPAVVYQGSETETPTPTSTPTATLASLTLLPVADTYVATSYPSTNYGSATTIQTDNSPLKDFLIKFEVSGISGRQITDVRLRLYNVGASVMGGDFHSVSDNTWAEGTVTWNNAPVADATSWASLASVQANNWYEVDLTALIVADGIYSLRVSSASTDGADYSSKEGANPPQLVVTYIDSMPTATILTDTPTETSIPTIPPTASPIVATTSTASVVPTTTNTPVPTNTAPGTSTPSATVTRTPSQTPTAVTYTPTKSPTPPRTSTASPTFTPTNRPAAEGSHTASLLHMNGSDGLTSFTDETGRLWAAVGNAQIDTAQLKFGDASALFDGTGDYLTSPDSNAFHISGDFTIDAWVRFNALPSAGNSATIFSQYVDGNNYQYCAIQNQSGTYQLVIRSRSAGTDIVLVAKNTTLSTNTWYHFACVRHGSNYLLFQNGVQVGTTVTNASAIPNYNAEVQIGALGGGQALNGWIDELRVSQGIARWISNFSPPSSEYAYDASIPESLVAYWNFENVTGTTVPDEATNGPVANNASLVNGASIQTTGAQGSSVFFDGTDDYASVPDQAEIKKNGSFTVSAWINTASLVTNRTQYILRKAVSATDFDYAFTTTSTTGTATPTPPANVDANGKLVFSVGDITPNKVIGPVLPLNTWTLVTGVYDAAAGELRLYINGTLSAVEKVTGTVTMGTGALTFSGAAPNQFHGGLDEVRFHNRALTSDEVSQLFGIFSTPTPLPSVIPSPTSVSTFTPTATALPISAQQWGTGDDGSITINTGETYNINSSSSKIAGRGCVDAPAYSVTSLSSTIASLSSSAVDCLSAGDEVMLINLWGPTTSSNYNAGVYEILRVASVSGNSVVFTRMKTHWYGDAFHSDANIGTGTDQQRVMLMRVPNYENVTVNGTLTSSAFDGYKYGVLAFRVHGTLTGSTGSSINMSNRGFPGAPGIGNALGYSAGGNAGSNLGWEPASSGGGGGHATTGGNGGSESTAGSGGNVIYGAPQLSQLFMGSGGGRSNLYWYREGDQWRSQSGTLGGPGGGIIFISGQTINFTGSVVADGAAKPASSNPDNLLRGGGGAGGSIRLEGNAITLGTLSANGGSSSDTYGYGSKGRIAVYYQSTYSEVVSYPVPYTALLGQAATPTPGPTAISFATPSSYGTGKDGNLTVGTTFNLNTNKSGSRTCADGAAYNITELSASWAKLSPAPASGCFAADDEILLVHLMGTGSNIGAYEYLRVGGAIGDTVYFKTSKANFYGANADDDSNIGTGTGQQRVMLMRVPNYENVTLNSTLTSNTFDGYKYGVVAFRVHGTLTGNVNGVISMNSRGFPGSALTGVALGYSPGGNAQYNNANGIKEESGGGGGHATTGGPGGYRTGHGAGGSVIYGTPPLSQLFMGSGGGSSNLDWYDPTHSNGRVTGGYGGGIIFVAAQTINLPGSITANGQPKPVDPNHADNPLRGGAGAGGSIRIEGNTITVGSVSAAGGSAGESYGYGGSGRIAIYYSNSLTNNSTLCAQASTYCQNTSQVPTPTATVTAPTPTNTVTPVPAPQGWYSNSYTYSTAAPHAVASVDRVNFTDTFTYDENGNMLCRIENGFGYTQTYNAENRIASIAKRQSNCDGSVIESWSFAYDGDGVRVGTAHFAAANPDLTSFPGTTPSPTWVSRYYFGGAYETRSDGTWKKYYAFAGQTIAMKDSEGIQYFLTDHLGSILATLGSDGTLINQQRYLPFGAVRTDVDSITQTDFGYTGQRKLDSGMGGIMDYKARFYSPYINHFLQPDSIIPSLASPQSWNRYSYVSNNPINASDPSGHKCVGEPEECLSSSGVSRGGFTGGASGYKGSGWVRNPGAHGGGGNCKRCHDNDDVPYGSPDGGWNDPQYSTWNLLRNGSACTACHVTHDQPGDWGIPTNSELDRDLVFYYRSNDRVAQQVHWAAYSYVGNLVVLTRETIVIGHYYDDPNYVQVANKIGANYFQPSPGMTTTQVEAANERFIVNGVQDGSRFVQSSIPRPGKSGLRSEISWLTQSNYSSGADMMNEVSTSVFRTMASIFGISGER